MSDTRDTAPEIGVQVQPQHAPYQAMRRAWSEAEELGADMVFTWDHFYPLYGDPDGSHFESLALQAAMAEVTDRARIGALVMCNSYRNSQYLADALRTVDHISGGRLIVGIGSGWFQRDYDEYGFEFGTHRSRLEALDAAIPTILDRLERLDPPPVRRTPLLIAGTGEQRTLRMVARYADAWHASFPSRPSDLEPAVAALRRWCDEIGRDAEDIEWAVGVEPDDLDRFLAEDAPTYVEMGFSQFTLGFNGPNWRVAMGRPWLGWRDAMNAARQLEPAGAAAAG